MCSWAGTSRLHATSAVHSWWRRVLPRPPQGSIPQIRRAWSPPPNRAALGLQQRLLLLLLRSGRMKSGSCQSLDSAPVPPPSSKRQFWGLLHPLALGHQKPP